MSKAYKEKELFDKVRGLPPELNLGQIDQLIQDIDSGKVTSTKNGSLNNFFTFKTIIMTSIGIILSTIFIFFMYPTKNEDLGNLGTNENAYEIQIEQIVVLDEIKYPLNTVNDTENQVNPPVSFSSLEPMDLQLLPTAIYKKLNLSYSDITIITEGTENDDEVIFEEKEVINYDTNPIYRNVTLGNKYPETVPELSNWAMKKYKRELLKALLQDGLILSKGELTEMKLRENEIILNDKKLNDSYFLKYRNLVSEIGYGPERKILINTDFILIGDFTKDGFIGTGRGRFSSEVMSSYGMDDSQNGESKDALDLFISPEKKKLLEEWEKKVEENEIALDEFASKKSVVYTPSKAKYFQSSVNLRRDEPKQLRNELYSLLIENNLIVNKSSLVVIEFSDNNIRINGEELDNEKSETFSNLLKKYRISKRKNRQIRMSEFIFKAGDFQTGKFKGTITYFYK